MHIIGAGLIGTAAAKYLAQAGYEVTLIGPAEPEPGQQAHVYASHYDQARVQRQIGFDRRWTDFHLKTAEAYQQLQRETGIPLFHPVGCLYVCPDGPDEYLETARAEAQHHRVRHSWYESADALQQAFPLFKFLDQAVGYYEPAPSGHLNPRAVVRAQLQAFKAAGGQYINDVVTGLDGKTGHINLLSGSAVRAQQILLAPGSFVNFNNLLPKPLDILVKGETIILARLSGQALARWQHAPTLLYEIVREDHDGIYFLPPVQYPDGHWYAKIGMNMPSDQYFTTLAEARHWFEQGDSASQHQQLKDAFLAFAPTLDADGWQTKRCIITRTKNRIPYLDKVDERLFVATACNGYSAMSADAIGQRAAQMLIENAGCIDMPAVWA